MADLEFYRSRLRVNKHLLDDELEVQSQYQEEISRELAAANTRMLRAKDLLARTEATVISELKEGKMSDTHAAGMAKKDQRRREDFDRFQECREEHEQWLGLYDAWQRRGYSLKTLADLFNAQYFSVTSAGSSTREVGVDIGRAAMRAASHKLREVRMDTSPAHATSPRRRLINDRG